MQKSRARLPFGLGHGSFKILRQRPTLPPSCPSSTIGGGGLNFRVRNGTGCDPSPMATGKVFSSAGGTPPGDPPPKRRETSEGNPPNSSPPYGGLALRTDSEREHQIKSSDY